MVKEENVLEIDLELRGMVEKENDNARHFIGFGRVDHRLGHEIEM